MKKILILFIGWLAIVNAVKYSAQERKAWDNYKTKYLKNYGSRYQDETRFKIFVSNKRSIDKHNRLYEKKGISYKLAITEHADQTEAEFSNEIGLKIIKRSYHLKNNMTRYEATSITRLPPIIDWNARRIVRNVVVSNECGVCHIIAEHDEELMKETLLKSGYLDICIDATLPVFRFFKSGVYRELKCAPRKLTHVIITSGVGMTNKSKEFFILESGVGKSLGSKGYIKFAQNKRTCPKK